MKTELVEYAHDGKTLEAYVAYDEKNSQKRPGILIFHAYEGRGEFVCKKAELMAEWGYVGMAMDVYGKGIVGTNHDENMGLLMPFMNDRVYLLERLLASYQVAQNHPLVDASSLAAFGFCFGGLCVLDLARSGVDLAGVASFHGVLTPAENLKSEPIKAKVLVMHGHDDPGVLPEQVLAFEKEMTKAKVDWQVHVYGQTLHSFTNPNANDLDRGLRYSKTADQRSFQSLRHFLEELYQK